MTVLSILTMVASVVPAVGALIPTVRASLSGAVAFLYLIALAVLDIYELVDLRGLDYLACAGFTLWLMPVYVLPVLRRAPLSIQDEQSVKSMHVLFVALLGTLVVVESGFSAPSLIVAGPAAVQWPLVVYLRPWPFGRKTRRYRDGE